MTRGVAEWMPSLLAAGPGETSRSEAGWRGLPLPAAFLWGDRDDVTPLAQGEALAALAQAPITVLEGVGHIPQIEAPEAFRAALLAALAQL